MPMGIFRGTPKARVGYVVLRKTKSTSKSSNFACKATYAIPSRPFNLEAIRAFLNNPLLYTGATSNVPVISVLTAPFSLPPNRALLLRIMSLFGKRKNGRVKTKITGTFEVAPVYKERKLLFLVGQLHRLIKSAEE